MILDLPVFQESVLERVCVCVSVSVLGWGVGVGTLSVKNNICPVQFKENVSLPTHSPPKPPL